MHWLVKGHHLRQQVAKDYFRPVYLWKKHGGSRKAGAVETANQAYRDEWTSTDAANYGMIQPEMNYDEKEPMHPRWQLRFSANEQESF